VWAGNFFGAQGLPPPENSYGADPDAEVAVLYLQLEPGGSMTIPAAAGGAAINRCAYFVDGNNLQIGTQRVSPKSMITLKAGQEAQFTNPDPNNKAEVLILQGRPIGEPVAQQGPFVMNTNAEIQEAFKEYRRTQFGGWPWPKDEMVFPQDKPRFSFQNGIESFPPSQGGSCAADKSGK
jgi:redox-sensitive bicupin YhaK (pirin superfamily)